MARKAFCILTLACLIALSGCAAIDKFHPQRTVEDNVFFSSSNPQIRMKVKPELSYLGEVEGSPVNNRAGGLRTFIDDDEINSTQRSYIFTEPTKTGKFSQGIVIRLCTITGDPDQWSPDILADAGNILETGTIAIEDKSTADGILASSEPYRYGIFTSNDLFTKNEAALIAERGITIPRCLLVKALEKTSGLGNKSRMHLLYFEDIGGTACSALTDTPTLSEEQRTLIASFVDRSNAAIRFMDSGKIEAEKRLITAPPAPEKKAPPAAPIVKKAPAVPAVEKAPVPTEGPADIGAKLHTLKQLLDEGLITQEDYDKKKKELLEEF